MLPEHRLLRRRRVERPAGPAAGHDRLLHRPARGRAGGARGPRHRAFRRLRDQDGGGVTRDYLELEFGDGDRVFVPSDQLHKISRYVGAEAGDPPLSQAGRQGLGADEDRAPGEAAQALAGELINLYAERRRRAGHAFAPGRRVADRVRGRLPLPRDARPDGGDRGREGRHGGGAPDGPPHLRRRGLRQDRGGAARRVQGGRGRQAGHVPGADHRARPAALRHLRRAPARLPAATSRWSRASARPRSSARCWRASPRARSTS